MKKALFFAVLALRAASGAPQGGDFRPALPGYDFQFPRDHGMHEEYRTEWWYYTGHLTAENGHRYGFEVTFFRVGVTPPGVPSRTRWDLHDLALAHFAVTDLAAQKFRYAEKLNRASPFTASFAAGYLDVFNEGWSVRTLPDGGWHLVAADGTDALDLTLRSQKPPAVHGENGISVKAEGVGSASHYYSMTRLEVTGTIDRQRCRGLAWMDHEFGSSNLRENQQGWDWFCVQFDDDSELMLYQIRRSDGTPDPASSGSLINSDGSVIHLRRDQMHITPLDHWRSPHSGAVYPMGWRISIPEFRIEITVTPEMRDQELMTRASTNVTYWEGATRVNGTFDHVAVSGVGYTEMTGYDRKSGVTPF
ncbi:MAG TPA: lipocalin-like domain-containing protein [Thermoanaerobaculia bacterium]|nr:lipocalin-like domain-containing protein [Thermoanaerobaculia bacterium]